MNATTNVGAAPRRFMIDLETLSTGTDAAILSIGIAEFNPVLQKVVPLDEMFIRHVDGRVDMDTVIWWSRQEKSVKEHVFRSTGRVTLYHALQRLSEYITPHDEVWGNGATMDITVLESAYERLNLPIPWRYWNIRDYRTFMEVCDRFGFQFVKRRAEKLKEKTDHTPHAALSDAVFQCEMANEAFGFLEKVYDLTLTNERCQDQLEYLALERDRLAEEVQTLTQQLEAIGAGGVSSRRITSG